MAKTALVVGPTGAIGSRIHEHLCSMGWTVLSTSRQKPANQFQFGWDAVFSQKISALRSVDLIINSASPNREWAAAHPDEFLEWMRDHGRRLVKLQKFCDSKLSFSMSTVHVYGDYSEGVLGEGSALNGSHPYAGGHKRLEGELLNTGWQVFRLSNTFGTAGTLGKLDPSAVTNDLARQIAQNGRAMLSEKQPIARDFLPMTTFLQILTRLIEKPEVWPVVNICSSRKVRLDLWRDFILQVHEEGPSGSAHFPEPMDPRSASYSSLLGKVDIDQLTRDAKHELSELLGFLGSKSGSSA